MDKFPLQSSRLRTVCLISVIAPFIVFFLSPIDSTSSVLNYKNDPFSIARVISHLSFYTVFNICSHLNLLKNV